MWLCNCVRLPRCGFSFSIIEMQDLTTKLLLCGLSMCSHTYTHTFRPGSKLLCFLRFSLHFRIILEIYMRQQQRRQSWLQSVSTYLRFSYAPQERFDSSLMRRWKATRKLVGRRRHLWPARLLDLEHRIIIWTAYICRSFYSDDDDCSVI